jgi:acyl carrier protein
LPDDGDLSQAGLGYTPGWDSLRHITLLLDIEAMLGVRFTSGEMEGAQSYRELAALVTRKQAEHGHG